MASQSLYLKITQDKKIIYLDAEPSSTVESLKARLLRFFPKLDPSHLMLVKNGVILREDFTLDMYRLQSGEAVDLRLFRAQADGALAWDPIP